MSEVGRARLISGKKTECDFFSKPYVTVPVFLNQRFLNQRGWLILNNDAFMGEFKPCI